MVKAVKQTWSWGNYPLAQHQVYTPAWRHDPLPPEGANTLLPYGKGRSYGDVPINDGGILISTEFLNHFISFDQVTGVLRCESGCTLRDIFDLAIPFGWFLPVTPGTQFVTVGGGIANDVHGKNHHSKGTFGRHINGFELIRSDHESTWCSPNENSDLFAATIGGLGLTGLITTVEIQLMAISSHMMDIENIIFENIDAGLDLFEQFDQNSTYTVAWIDCLASGDNLGRGIFTRAEHNVNRAEYTPSGHKLIMPVNLPSLALNKLTVSAFNELYYRAGRLKAGNSTVDFESFFYPLDKILYWNRIYGKNGFFQYQCVIPTDSENSGRTIIKKILSLISSSGNASFLAVLKRFGTIDSPGLLSFPIPGITLALDFPNREEATLNLLTSLDDCVMAAGGRVYPAKDARMSTRAFKQYFPNWSEFSRYIDPRFSSSFWRRVTG